GDFDGDGAPDLLVTENNGPARLLHNQDGGGASWPRSGPSARGSPRSTPSLHRTGVFHQRRGPGPGAANHWLAIRLRGRRSNREGLGTRVVLQAGGQKQTGWVRG